MNYSPALLAAEATKRLPQIIRERKHGAPATSRGLDTSHSSSLLTSTRARSAVAVSGGWPSSLQVDASLAGAESVHDIELGGHEGPSLVARNICVEEGVDVAAYYFDDVAELAGVLLPDVQRLSGGAWASVTGGGEG